MLKCVNFCGIKVIDNPSMQMFILQKSLQVNSCDYLINWNGICNTNEYHNYNVIYISFWKKQLSYISESFKGQLNKYSLVNISKGSLPKLSYAYFNFVTLQYHFISK